MPDKIEFVLLTGGASTRMGADKATLLVDGTPLAKLIAKKMLLTGWRVTVCGREPIEKCEFLRDDVEYQGPLAALAGFEPKSEFVFVAACDMPGFDHLTAEVLFALIGSSEAAVPNVGGRLQPLAALYAARAFPIARELFHDGKRSMMAWLDQLDVRQVHESELDAYSIDPESLMSANTPGELEHRVKLGQRRPIRFSDALFHIYSQTPAAKFEEVSVARLVGRILGEPVVATRDHPACDASAVDGFALCEEDRARLTAGAIELNLEGTVGPGESVAGLRVSPGQAIRVLTGAAIPSGTAAVVMREQVEESAGTLRLRGQASPWEHIRRRAEEFRAGDVIVPAGVRAHHGVVAAAAMTGKATWQVGIPPSVAILVTGDELVSVGAEAVEGDVFDSHTPALTAALREIGIEPHQVSRCGDSEDETREALAAALNVATVVITTGGVSGGERDYVRQAMAGCGVGELFAGVRIKPGRPVVFGATLSIPRKFVFGLPGNPMAALVAFEFFVKPFLEGASGLVNVTPQFQRASLGSEVRTRPGLTELVPIELRYLGDILVATPLAGRRSHMFGGLANANGLAFLGGHADRQESGSTILYVPWGTPPNRFNRPN